MQIFVTDPCPQKCAEALDDKRVNKMILESSQLLSAALFLNNAHEQDSGKMLSRKISLNIMSNFVDSLNCSVSYPCFPAGPGWHNHPLAKWAAESRANYSWLNRHLFHLLVEYEARSDKRHAYANHSAFYTLSNAYIKGEKQTPFLNCTAPQFKDSSRNIHKVYREYLSWKWREVDSRKPVWSKPTNKPEWYSDSSNS